MELPSNTPETEAGRIVLKEYEVLSKYHSLKDLKMLKEINIVARSND